MAELIADIFIGVDGSALALGRRPSSASADAGFRWLEELARRTDADAFVLGECDTERLELLAVRLRLVARYAAPR